MTARPDNLAINLWITLRPAQWPKNLLLFAALIFSAGDAWSVRDPAQWLPLLGAAVGAFLVFTVASAGAYCVNDALDADRDRRHPRKRLRPIAAGRLSRRLAVTCGAVLLASAVAAAALVSWQLSAVVAGYGALTTAYSLVLKHIAVLDVIAVAGGFVLRAFAGAVAVDVRASSWLLLITALGALALALTKRRQELALLGVEGVAHRGALGGYSAPALSLTARVALGATGASYALYAASAGTLPADHSMLLTLPFVLYGLVHFSRLATRAPERAVDELLTRDPGMVIAILGFAVTALAVLAVHR